jgi:uracil-DNA glycosylase
MVAILNIDDIYQCEDCNLCSNQKPILQKDVKLSPIFWVGLSAVKVTGLFDIEPLAATTNTGKLISEIESEHPHLNFYRTNIVKCLPLNAQGKIRYPTNTEMDICFHNIQTEIFCLNPAVIILLGNQVAQFFMRKFNKNKIILGDSFQYDFIELNKIKLLAVHHPSYIQIYRRKYSSNYKNAISSILNRFFKKDNV